MRLLLDLGNTRLKWALHQDGGWHAGGAVAWTEPVAEMLASAWQGLAPIEVCLGASVTDASRESLVATQVQGAFGRATRWLRSPSAAGGVRNAYAEPARLGVDRFLAMLAAHAQGLSPCVLVGVGTALTVDALTADGRHLGGVIAPGPHQMQQALLGATAQVRIEHAGNVRPLADNTADAVASGCWGACAGMVERFVRDLSGDLGGAPRLLLGGGDAAALQALLPQPSMLVEDSVLRGLAVWGDLSDTIAGE